MHLKFIKHPLFFAKCGNPVPGKTQFMQEAKEKKEMSVACRVTQQNQEEPQEGREAPQQPAIAASEQAQQGSSTQLDRDL